MVRKGVSFFRSVFRIPAASEVRLTLILWSILFLATMSVWATSNYFDRRLLSQQNGLRAESALNQAQVWMTGFLANYAQGLTIIAQSTAFTRAVSGSAADSGISSDFLAWLIARPAIAQLRYINADGIEIIRAERIGNEVTIVDASDLQDKSSRYYFQQTISLPPNALYLSPIDLNVEFGRIEVPWRPMIRVAMPVYQSDPEPLGILIMNINATNLLKVIEAIATPLGQPVQILNSGGYWLTGIPPDNRFGFMFDNDMTLAQTDPALWQKMLEANLLTVDTDTALTVYSGVSLPALMTSSTTFDSVVTDDPELHLLIRFPAAAGFFSLQHVPGFIGLFILCGLFSIFIAATISGRKLAEEKARAAEEQVVRLDRLAGLGALVAGVSHELNTPIGNALITATTVDHRAQTLAQSALEGRIGKNALTTMVTDIRDGVTMMNISLQRASEIIRNFKQFAVDQTSERQRRFALDAYILETLHLLQPQFSRSGHKLEAGRLDPVIMDSFPGPLGQVITNLLTNARVHAFKGKAHGTVTVTAETSGPDHVIITVSDDGNGIAPEQLDQVLIPFFSTAFGEGGSGLGLAIVDNIVTGVLAGRLTIDSAPCKGTRVVLLVPIAAPADAGQLQKERGDVSDENGH